MCVAERTVYFDDRRLYVVHAYTTLSATLGVDCRSFDAYKRHRIRIGCARNRFCWFLRRLENLKTRTYSQTQCMLAIIKTKCLDYVFMHAAYMEEHMSA
jgi:hypothetical protein